MANRAYLCCTNLDRTYPSFRNARYRPEVHTLAGARDRVPLLWLALFGPDDLRTDMLLSEEGEDVGTPAPVASKARALEQFERAIPRLEAVYPRIGGLGEHIALFRQMLKSARGKFLTIELEEIAWLSPSERTFYERLRKALAYFAGADVTRVSQTLTAITGVDPDRRLLPPKSLFSSTRQKKADLIACMSVVGMSHIRPVPWEEAPERPSTRTKPSLTLQLHEALDSGNEALARDLLARGANPSSPTPLRHALAMDYVAWGKVSPAMGRSLMEAGFDLTKRVQGYTSLQRAIAHDNLDFVRGQIALGADATYKDGFGRTPLALAACRGALKCLDFFLQSADEKTIKDAIRRAERQLAKSTTGTPTEEARMRKAVERLRAMLES